MNTQITAIGHFLPIDRIYNEALETQYGLDPGRIFSRTGIKCRRAARDGTSSTDLACSAITEMLKSAPIGKEEVDLVLASTLVPDYFFPSSAVSIIHNIGFPRAWGFDVPASCSGFLYALHVARTMIKCGEAENIVVCATERLSVMINNYDYKTGVLFGDGAGAVLLQGTTSSEAIINSSCKVEADHLNDVYFKTPFNSLKWNSEKFELKGYEVFERGVSLAVDMAKTYLIENHLNVSDFDYLVPHQANGRMLKRIAGEIGFSFDKVLVNIDKYGNTGSASIPICLSDFYQQGVIRKGERLLLLSIGAGYTVSITDVIWGI